MRCPAIQPHTCTAALRIAQQPAIGEASRLANLARGGGCVRNTAQLSAAHKHLHHDVCIPPLQRIVAQQAGSRQHCAGVGVGGWVTPLQQLAPAWRGTGCSSDQPNGGLSTAAAQVPRHAVQSAPKLHLPCPSIPNIPPQPHPWVSLAGHSAHCVQLGCLEHSVAQSASSTATSGGPARLGPRYKVLFSRV